MKDLVIVGAGGHGRETLQCVADINARTPKWNVLGFVDDACTAPEVAGVPLLGTTSWLRERNCSVVVAIGSPAVRRRVIRALELIGVSDFATVVHPTVSIGASVELGMGTMIGAGVVLTVDIVVGRHVIVNTMAVISHDCRVADFATLAPRACLSGSVQVGEGADLGANCTVLPGVQIGAWGIVGAGAAVIQDVQTNETVVGVPARTIKIRHAGWQECYDE